MLNGTKELGEEGSVDRQCPEWDHHPDSGWDGRGGRSDLRGRISRPGHRCEASSNRRSTGGLGERTR